MIVLGHLRCEISSSRTKNIVVCDRWFAAPSMRQSRHRRNSPCHLSASPCEKPEGPYTAKRSRVAFQHGLVVTFGVPQDDLPRGSRLKYPDSLQDVMAGVTLCSVIHDEEATRIRARSYPQAPSSR